MKQFSPLIFVLLVALTLRLAISLVALPHPERAFSPDTASYLDFANHILSGQGWEYPSAIRTPVYPLFLAGVMAVAGENAFLIILAQTLVSPANIGLMYWLASEIFDAKVSMLSALLLAVSMESITHAFYLLTETLFTFLFLLSTVFLRRAKRIASWKLSIAAGLSSWPGHSHAPVGPVLSMARLGLPVPGPGAAPETPGEHNAFPGFLRVGPRSVDGA